MNWVQHPSEFLIETLTKEIRDVSLDAEQQKNLHKAQLDIICQQNWFNMYVPKVYGGLELTLPEILRIEECLGWADGSTGWVVTLCSGAAWFVGFLDPQLRREVFTDNLVCFAGSGAITGTANKTSMGYMVNGYWKYATGSLNANIFTVNCHLHKDGRAVFNPDGTPKVISILLMRNEVIVHRTWNSMGMIATGSHSIEVSQVQVPLNRAFIIAPSRTTLEHIIFQYPFLQLAETTLAVVISGLACRFLDLCAELFSKKEKSNLQSERLEKLAYFDQKLREFRTEFYTQCDAAWQMLTEQRIISDHLLKAVSEASHFLVQKSREIVNELYPYCGLEAADTRNEINRVWRNFHTASQHSLFRP